MSDSGAPAAEAPRKSRWDNPGDAAPEAPDASSSGAPPISAAEATDAAAKAAAIAAKIAASLRPAGSSGQELVRRAGAAEGDFVKDIEINDLRNRYVLTKSGSQKQIQDETGASIETRGVWVPDRTRMPPGEMPLYLHIVAKSQIILDAAVAEVNKLIDQELGPLIEERTLIARARATGAPLPPTVAPPTVRPKWPEEKLFINIESMRNFNVRAKVVGPGGMFVKFIQAETGARVQIKGRGSGFLENDTGRESDEPMHISVVAPTDDQIQRAKMLADDLLMVLRIEYDKARSSGNQGGGGVYQGQGNYGGGQQAQAGGDPYAGGYQQQGGAADASQAQAAAATGAQPGEGSSAEAWEQYRAYWAAYGYDINDPQFQAWQASQMQAQGGAQA
ncbi:uncharacterized protein EHS24_007053 [Apiotrichum porosum]|uniref:K Homology domain-containing protein n=1 Tax=Apiotrichum porosum TaxID=105984 RepID=A0A427XX10_9TREE|nr:uncharacterized protein EHS24_007053 [Apiotrichum porosum]RSH83373.1 hypothetical protein EHS24_007053 [Apiotrichum porosum]